MSRMDYAAVTVTARSWAGHLMLHCTLALIANGIRDTAPIARTYFSHVLKNRNTAPNNVAIQRTVRQSELRA